MPCPICDDTGWKPIEEHGIRRVVRCDCWRAQIGRNRLADANIPKRYLHCTLANFTAYNESLEKAVARAQRVAEAFPVVNQGLLLEGQPGVGKTHLAVAVLKQVIESSGARGIFYDTRELNERRLTIFTSNYQDIPDDTDPNSLLFRIGFRMRSRLHEMCEFLVLDGADYREMPANGGIDDLLTMWKMRKKSLPSPRGGRQARAQLREPAARDGRADLKWPGGRAGS
jgi:DNA replication protein DnaC